MNNFNKKITTICVLLILFAKTANCQQLLINEFCSLNSNTCQDGDGDFSDWLEIVNNSSDTLNLSEFYLSDNPDNIKKWRFPSVEIFPGDFLLVFASGKNTVEFNEIHTNFSIDNFGEVLTLSDLNSQIIDCIMPVKLSENKSFGRKPDASTNMEYFNVSSPGVSNNNSESHVRLFPVQFSVKGGFYNNEFELLLTNPDSTVTIIYTTDGSEPDLKSIPFRTFQYKNDYPVNVEDEFGEFLTDSIYTYYYHDPIKIKNNSQSQNRNTNKSSTIYAADYFPLKPVLKANVIRAKAVKNGYEESYCITETYFVFPTQMQDFKLPVFSINLGADKLFDYNIGIYTPGVDFDNWRKQNPYEEDLWPNAGNFKRRGEDGEFEANVEYFVRPEDTAYLNQIAGIRINGGESRSLPMKSLRLCPDYSYGCDNLNFKFFNNCEDSVFKNLVLRNSGADFPTTIWEPRRFFRTMLRDAYIHTLCRDMNFDTQAYQPVIVFVNGELQGLHNLREKYDKDYFKRVYKIECDDLDYLSANGSVLEGSNWHFNNLINYITDHGVVSDEDYLYITKQIDVSNFIDYYIAQIFIHNTDWPANNLLFWRKNLHDFEPGAEPGHDGRWRWLMTDTDLGFGLHDLAPEYEQNTIEYLMDEESSCYFNMPWSTFLFRNLIQNETFKTQFLESFEYHLLNTFSPENSITLLDSLADNIRLVIPYHLSRWTSSFYSVSDWENSINEMRVFAVERPCVVRNFLKEYFDIDDVDFALGVCEEDIIKTEEYCSLISIYPNPSKDFITIKLADERYYAIETDIIDITGKSVLGVSKTVFDTKIIFNISTLKSGLYCVLIKNGNDICYKKFIKYE